MIRCTDWRTARSADVEPLLAAEARAWLRQLHWDVSDAWRVIEPARQAGQLSGRLLLNESDRPVGWTAFLRHGRSVQVMAVVSPDRAATDLIVDEIVASAECRDAEVAIICVRAAGDGLADALLRHGFDVEPYRYLRCALPASSAPGQGVVPWRDHDEDAARLCARAYADSPGVRAFAVDDSLADWREYLTQLRKGPGCGWFMPELSFVSPGANGELQGLIMVTDLGPGTAHIAQVVVDPAVRRRGLGRRLVQAALQHAAPAFERMTLLVSDSNRPALDLYGSLGFETCGTFVVAVRRQPILSTSLALATGGESTRR